MTQDRTQDRTHPDRPQTLGEEIANAISHGLGLLLALASLPILVWQAQRLGGAGDVVAASVFATTAVVLYGISMLHHALPQGAAKRWFNRMPTPGLVWLVAGGLSYTLGAVVFLLDHRLRYAHAVWHLFVLGGSVCHFFAALGYAHGA